MALSNAIWKVGQGLAKSMKKSSTGKTIQNILAEGKGPRATSGSNGSLSLPPAKGQPATTGGDKGFSLLPTSQTKPVSGGDSGFQLQKTPQSSPVTGTKYADGTGQQTDWSKLIREELDKGDRADAGLLQGYLDARNQKITSDPSLAQYANDDIAQEARAYIAAQSRPQYQEFDRTPYSAAQQAQDAYWQAQLKQTVAGLETQKGSVTDSAEEAARQAYISYMQSRNTLPQALAASGYAGGLADSQRLALDTNLQNSQQAILKSRDAALNDIDTAVNNARLESSVQGAQAQMDLARDAIAAYQSFLNQQNAYANQDFWTRYGYDFQAAQDAINRDYQTQSLLQQQQWQAQQGKDNTAQATQTATQKQAYESAWNLISAGVMPSADLLSQAGLTAADAQAYVAYIQRQLAAQRKQQLGSNQNVNIGDRSLDPYKKVDDGGVAASEQKMQEFKNALAAAARAGVDAQQFQNIADSIWGQTSREQQEDLLKYITKTLGIPLG